jgi:predicted dehydrogenase
MTRLPVGVVGVGHLGKEHARVLASFAEVDLVGVVDPRTTQAETVAAACRTRAFADHRQLLPLVRAAVIATPTTLHHAVARDFLDRGVHLLVEKPLAANSAEGQELARLAARRGCLLQVGHIERFNPAFEALQKEPLRPLFMSCERYGKFTGRSTDVGVVLDLMIHDLDLVLGLVRAPVRRVEALGVSVLGGHEDIAQARVTFTSGCVADLRASRVHPTGVRTLQAWGAEGYAGIDFGRQALTLMQPGAVTALERDCKGTHAEDQLTRELREFVHCVRQGGAPRVDSAAACDALALAGLILESMRTHAWEGRADGPAGPHHLPAPRGTLFPAPVQRAA